MTQIVVITGASAGLGRAIARAFARRRAHIGLIARGRERLEATAREVRGLCGDALPLACDVAATLAVIAANRAAPGLLDRYLARSGYSGQLARESETPGRPDNLFAPMPGDVGAHGRFGDRAKRSSAVLGAAAAPRRRRWM